MKKILKIIGGLVLIIIVVALATGNNKGQVSSSSPSQTSPATEVAAKVPDAKLTASALYAEYDKNVIAADEKYKEKLLEVSGKVQSVDKDIMGSMYVAIKTNDLIGVVQCMLDDTQKTKAAALSKDQQVTVDGINKGRTLTNIILRDCSIM